MPSASIPPRRAGCSLPLRARRLGLVAGLVALAFAPDARAGEPVSFNTELVTHVELNGATDISATGDVVIVGRGTNGVTLLNVTNPSSPTTYAVWTHPTAAVNIKDARPSGNVLWCGNERDGDYGCFALDITNPASPQLIAELGPPTFPGRVHNLWPDGSELYLSGSSSPSGNYILDVTNPMSPSVLSVIESDIHDNCVYGDSLYYAAGYEALYLVDVTNPAAPITVSTYNSATVDTLYYAHQAYPIPGTDYVILTEEIQRPIGQSSGPGSTRLIDFSDPLDPVTIWRYRSETMKTSPYVGPHNGYVVGDFLYLSHYHDGVKIFDVSVPAEPVEVGFYDTFPDLPTALFEGNWGVDPFQGPDRIFLSDRTYGYFHVSFNEARRTEIFGQVRDANTMNPIAGAKFESFTAARTTHTDGNGDYVFKTGSGLHDIAVTADGYVPNATSVELLPNGSLERDFLLTPTAVPAPEPAPLAQLALRIHPNPTRGVATLRFEIPSELSAAKLRVEVFDVRGRLVRRLADETAPAGGLEVVWDGRSESGFRVADGVYVVRSRVGGESIQERIVVRR